MSTHVDVQFVLHLHIMKIILTDGEKLTDKICLIVDITCCQNLVSF